MKYQVGYLDTYGNAEKLAWAAADMLSLPEEVTDLSSETLDQTADVYMIAFEMNKTTVPLSVMEVMDTLEYFDGKALLLLVACTSGLAEQPQSIERKIIPFLPDQCEYLGTFVCPGQVPADKIQELKLLTEAQPDNTQAVALLKYYQETQGRPDEDDYTNLREFLQGRL